MTGRGGSLQSVDPLGAFAGRRLTLLAGVAATVLAIALTLAQPHQIASAPLAVVAVGVAALAGLALVVVTAPVRAPVTRGNAVLVLVLGLAGDALFAAATWEQNALIRDDWGPFVLGLLLLALCPYRPPREIVVLAIAVSAVVGVVTVLETRFFTVPAPRPGYVLVSIVPILALALAGAAFSHSVLGQIAGWRRRADRASRYHAVTQEEGIVRSVQQSRVTILNRDVVPLFTELLEGGRVTAENAARAAEVSDAVRAVMVEDTQRTWLDDVVTPAHARDTTAEVRRRVADRARLAERMSFDQRAAIRALVSALTDRIEVHDVRIGLERTGDVCRVLLRSVSDRDAGTIAAALAPYLAVLRVVFEDISLDTSRPDLTLRFSYVCN